MRTLLLTGLAVVAVLLSWPPLSASAAPLVIPAPPREGGVVVPETPAVTAASWLVYDADADLVLASSRPDERRPMASTTKIMTAIVALKYGNLDDVVTVSERATDVGEAEVGLHPGERFPMRRLVEAFVIRSANDAAVAVAEHIGGSVEGFVEMMNQEAEVLGLDNTRFANPHGLDGEDHYSTASDLLELGLAAMSYPEFRQWATSERAPFPPAPDGTERSLTTTNLLLETYPGTIGVKTGFTGRAGLVFVAAAVREGRTLFSVVMGSEGYRAHFDDSRKLLDWGFDRFRAVAVVGDGSYVPPEPVRVVEEPAPPEPEPEPIVVEVTRGVDGDPPQLAEALGWVGRVVERMTGG